MKKTLCALLVFLLLLYLACSLPNSERIALPQLAAEKEIFLVPLDSRPVCSTMVGKLGKLAGINVILPPKDLLGNYQKPADSNGIWHWLDKNLINYPSGILSADLLLHGGLLQTRLHISSSAEREDFFSNCKNLRLEVANTPSAGQINILSVIPRLLVSDELLPDRWYKFHLMRYSQLLDMAEINNDYTMTAELIKYKNEIPSEILTKYACLFQNSLDFNKELLNFIVTNNIELIIGQDDSSPFGLPHRSARELEKICDRPELRGKAQLSYGADELAALLLAKQYLRAQNWRPRIYLQYNAPQTESKYMPYMAVSAGAALRNQIALVGGEIAPDLASADLALFIHCGDDNVRAAAEETVALSELLAQGKHVGLVDLSANFEADELLLPRLLRDDFPLNKLAAYAGWNTFSNSSGTALAQSIIFTGRTRELAQQGKQEELAALYAENLRFNCERFLEDCFYQKYIHPDLRPYLESFGITPTDLAAEDKQRTEYYIQKRLSAAAEYLLRRNLGRTPFYADAKKDYYLRDLYVGVRLPWARIFEVELTPGISVGSKNK